jgi:hypothetical protein
LNGQDAVLEAVVVEDVGEARGEEDIDRQFREESRRGATLALERESHGFL